MRQRRVEAPAANSRCQIQTLGFCATTRDKDNVSVWRCVGEFCMNSPRRQTAGVKHSKSLTGEKK